MRPEALTALVTHLALLVGVSSALALLLRGARIWGGRPAAAIVGGALAGALLGATVAGRAWPTWHERVVRGGEAERIALDSLSSRHQADLTALRATGVTGVAESELAAEHARERGEAESRLAAARAEHRRGRTFVLTAMLSVALACATWASSRRHREPVGSAELFAAATAGISATLFAALPAALLLLWLTDLPVAAALSCGGAAAAGSLFAGLPMRGGARGSRSVEVRVMALSTSLGAAVLLAWGVHLAAAAWVLVPGAGVLAGAAFGRVFPAGSGARRAACTVVAVVVMPAIAAYVSQQIDWLAVWRDWRVALLMGIAVVAAGDGQFIGASLGLLAAAPDRTRSRAGEMAMEMAASGLGLTQVAMALLLVGAGVVDPNSGDGQAVLGALLVSAVAVEVLAPSSRRALRAVRERARSDGAA